MTLGLAAGTKAVPRRDIARLLVVAGLSLIHAGCAWPWHRHHAAAVACPNPARVLGVEDGGGFQGGWVLVRRDASAEDTAARIAAAYHVRTQSLMYLHGFSVFPVPEGSKFLCDKALVEVHYDPPQGVLARERPGG
jgi:hypothetical protein